MGCTSVARRLLDSTPQGWVAQRDAVQDLQDLLRCAEETDPAIGQDIDLADRGIVFQSHILIFLHAITFSPFSLATATAWAQTSRSNGAARSRQRLACHRGKYPVMMRNGTPGKWRYIQSTTGR